MIIRHESAQRFLTIILIVVPISHALKCLSCEGNCKGADIGDATVCRPGFNVCMKVKSASKQVERVCGTLDACGFGVSENWGRRLYRQIKKVMGDTQKRSPWELEEYEKQREVFCCDKDFCNKAPGIFTAAPFPAFLTCHLLLYFFWKMFFCPNFLF